MISCTFLRVLFIGSVSWTVVYCSTAAETTNLNDSNHPQVKAIPRQLERKLLEYMTRIGDPAAILAGQPSADRTVRTEHFDRPPNWEGHRNRLLPDAPRKTRQRFGWQSTRHAGGKNAGEIGGWVQRSLARARYAVELPKTLTLNDRLEASGRLAVTRDEGNSGTLLGWFHDTSTGWRTPNSLALRVDGNGNKYWLFFEYGTQSGRTGGGGAFAGSRYQDTPTRPFAADGTSHPWKLVYDPAANNNLGEITFQVDQRVFRLSLNPGDREDGTELNRFGFWNQQTTGGGMEVWLDDLILNGRPYPFDHDPGWQGQGNNIEFTEAVVRPFHDFGYSPSSHTGGTAGEIGGIIWRDEQPCYYADHVGPLSLEDELRSSGKIAFSAAGADSAVYIGWFHAQTKRTNETPEHQARQRQYLGILLEGPSRIGHFFRPGYSTKTGSGFNAAEGPVFNPDDKVHHWSVHYQPQAAGGRGQITVTLDDQSKSIVLTAGDRETGAVFDRFGLFNMQTGGWHVRVFLDDLTYTCHARCVAGCSLQ